MNNSNTWSKKNINITNFGSLKRTPTSKQKMSWSQAKQKYPNLKPMGDADRDGVKNWADCKPFNKLKQDDNLGVEENIAGWKLRDIPVRIGEEPRVRDITTGREGRLLSSSGWSWKDVNWDKNTRKEENEN